MAKLADKVNILQRKMNVGGDLLAPIWWWGQPAVHNDLSKKNTMWKFKNFSGTHVLCETVKNCNFDSFQSSNSWSFENFSFENCSNLPKNSIQSLLNCLKLQFLISRKILLAEKLLIFHNYELTDILPCWLRGSHHFSWFCCYLDLWIDFPYFFVSWCVALIFVEFQWRPADFLQKFLVKSLYNLFWKLASF